MKKKKIDAVALGATLYIPAIHKNLLPVCCGEKYPGLRSVVVCTEDSILESDLPGAFEAIKELLSRLDTGRELPVFFRPRNIGVLEAMLQLPGIDRIDGFVLPKFDTGNMDAYLDLLMPHSHDFYIMPVIESLDMFEREKLVNIRQKLMETPMDVLSLRVGGEDMLKHFGLKRRCEESLYDLVAPASVLGEIISVFKPYGFNLSAPVYNCIGEPERYRREVEADLRQGFIGKSIIHPGQIASFNEAYRVSKEEFAMAEAMLGEETPAIIVQGGAMGEKFAHIPWARVILRRAEIYGMYE